MLATLLSVLLAPLLAAQAADRGVAVVGVVQDQSGAILQGAQIAIVDASGRVVQTAVTDANGTFRFDRIGPGAYDVRSEFPGFRTSTARVRVGNRSPGSLTIVMAIEGVTQEVSVTSGGAAATTSSAGNLNAIAADADTLDNLPVLDQDVVGSMTRFLD